MYNCRSESLPEWTSVCYLYCLSTTNISDMECEECYNKITGLLIKKECYISLSREPYKLSLQHLNKPG